MKLLFGKYKGKDTSETPTEYLLWLVENTDVNDPKYGANNRRLVEACNIAINANTDRGTRKAPAAAAPLKYAPEPEKKLTPKMISEFKTYIQQIYDAAEQMQFILDEYHADGTIKASQHLPV